VPIIVGPLYFAMGNFSWIIASLLLDDADLHLDRPLELALPKAHGASAYLLIDPQLVSSLRPASRTHPVRGKGCAHLKRHFEYRSPLLSA
jgi:hypothetical protein